MSKKALNKAKKFYKNSTKDLSPALLAFLSDSSLLRELKKITDAPATIYDKAMDSEYLSGLSGGGANHRLFDNGHSLFEAWEKVKNASPDDSLKEEVLGCINALWKDATTPKGLPFSTLEKESYEAWAETVTSMNIPGVNKEYLYDLMSFDALEILGTAMGVVGVALAFSKKDKEKLSELLGSMGIISILSANPLMGVFTIASTAYSYKVKKQKLDKKSLLQGGATSGVTALILGALGLPFIFELIIAMLVVKLIKKHVFSTSDFKTLILKNIKYDNIKITLKNVSGFKFRKAG